MKFLLLALLMSSLALWALMVLARRLDWLDRPDARKTHQNPTPAVGGLAWFLGFSLAAAMYSSSAEMIGLLLGCLMLAVCGAVDDRHPLPSIPRLIWQSLAALVAFWSIEPLGSLGLVFGTDQPLLLGSLRWPITVFMVVGVINAMNMIDGMDGALFAVAFVAFSAILVWTGTNATNGYAMLALLALAAMLPFALFNLRWPWQSRAKVFFGDGGSMPLGLVLAFLVVRLSQADTKIGQEAVFAPITALWLLAVPLIDAVSLMLRRVFAGKSPMAADQQHLHHVLQRLGFSVTQCVLVLVLASVTFVCIAWGFDHAKVSEPLQFAAFLLIAFGYHALMLTGLKRGRMAGRALRSSVSEST